MSRKLIGWFAAATLVPTLVAGQSVRVIHRVPWDTLAQTYRLFLPPAQPRALLVLLSDWGDTYAAFDRFAMQLPLMLQEKGLAVVQINNTPWQSNCFTDAPLAIIDSIVTKVMRDARVSAGRVVMGGVQMAGAAALRDDNRSQRRHRCIAWSRAQVRHRSALSPASQGPGAHAVPLPGDIQRQVVNRRRGHQGYLALNGLKSD